MDDDSTELASVEQPASYPTAAAPAAAYKMSDAPTGFSPDVGQDQNAWPEYQDRPNVPRRNRGTVVAIVIGCVVAAVLAPLTAWLIVNHLHRGNTAEGVADQPSGSHSLTPQSVEVPTTSPAAPPPPVTPPSPVVLPPGAVECGVAPTGPYPHAVRGNDVTSCPFAQSVRDAVNKANSPRVPASINAYSPVTKRHYPMTCAMQQRMITCRGGDDAVVYVY